MDVPAAAAPPARRGPGTAPRGRKPGRAVHASAAGTAGTPTSSLATNSGINRPNPAPSEKAGRVLAATSCQHFVACRRQLEGLPKSIFLDSAKLPAWIDL